MDQTLITADNILVFQTHGAKEVDFTFWLPMALILCRNCYKLASFIFNEKKQNFIEIYEFKNFNFYLLKLLRRRHTCSFSLNLRHLIFFVIFRIVYFLTLRL
jgi:hypothetical protein